jgi:hypothetical protein
MINHGAVGLAVSFLALDPRCGLYVAFRHGSR